MVKKLAGDKYTEEFLHDFAVRFGRETKCRVFVENFPNIEIGQRTVEKIHDHCRDYLQPHLARDERMDRFEALKRVASTSVFAVTKCLDMGPEAHSSVPALARSLSGTPPGSVFSTNSATAELVGDYMYCRPGPTRKIDKGGIRMFLHYGYPRFLHFYQIESLLEIRSKEGFGAPSEMQGIDPCVEELSLVAKPIVSSYDGSGVYYSSGGQLTLLSLHPANVRCSLGIPQAKSDLGKRPIELTVAGRAKNGSHFASKAVLFHHTHEMFGKPKKVTNGVLRELLGGTDPKKAILTF